MAPGLKRGLRVSLREGLSDRGGDHGVLALGHMRQRIPDPMNSAPLPCRAEHAGDGVAQAVMRVGDHQLDAAQPALDQGLSGKPTRTVPLRDADAEPDNLAPSSVETATAII